LIKANLVFITAAEWRKSARLFARGRSKALIRNCPALHTGVRADHLNTAVASNRLQGNSRPCLAGNYASPAPSPIRDTKTASSITPELMNASRRKLQRKYNKLIGLLDQGRKTSFVRLGAIMIPHSFLIVGRLRIRYAA